MRCQLRYDGQRLCARSRPGRDCSDEFPELAAIADDVAGRQVILDGEIVCVAADGKPDFAALRRRLASGAPRTGANASVLTPATLMIFDLLHLDGRAVRELPYLERRQLLAELALDGAAWRTPDYFVGQATALAAATLEHELEGIVAKRVSAPWIPGRRSPAWIKHKHRRQEQFVVTGWRPHDRAPVEFLIARRRDDGHLEPAGSVAFGLDAVRRQGLLDVLAENERPRRPGRRRSPVRWVTPVVEVLVDGHGRSGEALRDGVLRQVIPARVPGGTGDAASATRRG